MVELQPIFKKAYWALAAGGLVYILFIYALTYAHIQRLYVFPQLPSYVLVWLNLDSVLYANKINPSYWQDVNQVEQFGFLSMYHGEVTFFSR